MVSHAGGQITAVTMIDHYRIHWEIFLAVIFGLLLVLFAGPGGLRALLSFAITVLSIWKIMVPATLKGADPIWVGLLLVALLTVVIIVFVYGFDRRSLSAVLGSMLGTLPPACWAWPLPGCCTSTAPSCRTANRCCMPGTRT